MKRLLLLLCLFFPVALSAQYRILLNGADIVPGDYTFEDSVIVITNVQVLDSASQPAEVNGNLRYYIQTDSMFLSGQPPRLIDLSPLNQIIPTPGLIDFFKLDIRPAEMRSGPINVVIVWPSLVNPAFPITDSVFGLVNVPLISTVSLDPVTATVYHQLQPFPNPTTGMLQFPAAAAADIQRLRISDVRGTVWKEFQHSTINLHDLPEGIYWIQVFWNNGNSSFYPVIKHSQE